MAQKSDSQRLDEAIRRGRALRAQAADFVAAAKHEEEDLVTSLRERLLPSQSDRKDVPIAPE